MEKIKISLPILVEGKYDKNTLSQVVDANIITTGGFSVFNSKEKQALIRKIGLKNGIIILTDSDSGGRQIRSFISSILPKDKVFSLYIPRIKGKERRKAQRGKEGVLGVEGMSPEVLREVLSPFAASGGTAAKPAGRLITKADFYGDGLSGTPMAQTRRRSLAAYFELPEDMSANSLIEALNLISDFDGYKNALSVLFSESGEEIHKEE